LTSPDPQRRKTVRSETCLSAQVGSRFTAMTVDYELDGHVAVITINRPDARNAVSTAVPQGIEAAIDQLESDDDAWIGILTGAKTDKGYIFCAGADLKQMST